MLIAQFYLTLSRTDICQTNHMNVFFGRKNILRYKQRLVATNGQGNFFFYLAGKRLVKPFIGFDPASRYIPFLRTRLEAA